MADNTEQTAPTAPAAPDQTTAPAAPDQAAAPAARDQEAPAASAAAGLRSSSPRPGGRPAGGRPGGDRRPRSGGGKRFFRRRKVDYFSVNKIDDINYKDVDTLKQFVGDRGKILPRRHTGLSAYHQRLLRRAIKRARNIALLPFAGDVKKASHGRNRDA